MGETSLNEFLSLINESVELQQLLSHQILKSKALADVALSDDFLTYHTATIQFYLLAINDSIESSENLSEKSINFLMKIVRDNTDNDSKINL